MATTLPSFVELMSSLGLEQTAASHSLSSPHSSPSMPNITPPSPDRSRSSPPPPRDYGISQNRRARYSPYSPVFPASRRRGSSSSSSSSEHERRPGSTSPHPPSSPRSRRLRGTLTVNVYDSNCDLPANTPISTYVRRKTPGASPTSPTFSRATSSSPVAASTGPLTLPTLPSFFPHSASVESFPITPNPNVESLTGSSPASMAKVLPEVHSASVHAHRIYHTGVRLSSPPIDRRQVQTA
ncbi:unnamed protein product [Mycena citricolor]|uniref:Uncharacterized protein n=1 Tax=Mycena citricolor TaxID=2018698 RepID=A0AAD2K2T5_9AGAR|nr:unnamed protein product [Mycena citricolor]